MSICDCSTFCSDMDAKIAAFTANIASLDTAITSLSDGVAKSALIAQRSSLDADSTLIASLKTQCQNTCSASHALDATQSANYDAIVALNGDYAVSMKRMCSRSQLIAFLDEYESIKAETTEIRDLFLSCALTQ